MNQRHWRFIGGMRYGGTKWPFPGKSNMTSPFAVLELDESGVRIAPRWRLFPRWMLPPVVIPFGAIKLIEGDVGYSRAGVRFRTSGPGDGTIFWASPGTRVRLADALEELGVEVE